MKSRKPIPLSVKPEWQGFNSWRYTREPLEEAFAIAWEKFNKQAMGPIGSEPSHLDYLLTAGEGRPKPASERDRKVAASVIQWLGSPIGQVWLKSVMP